MKKLMIVVMACSLSANVERGNVPSPEYTVESQSILASADVKKKKNKKGKKISEKGKKKKKGFFSKVFGSK